MAAASLFVLEVIDERIDHGALLKNKLDQKSEFQSDKDHFWE